MPRSGGGIYSLPAGSAVANGDTAVADDLNVPLADLEADANTVRPVVAGGTGAASAADARTNLGLVIGTHVQAYDADLASWAGVTRASGFDTFAATPSSANLRALLTDEVGTGAAYFVGGALGTPASGTLTNCTGLPFAGLAAAAVVTESEGIGSNDNDTTLPTSAAVKDYVDNNIPSGITIETAVESTSGTEVAFTGISANAKRITLTMVGVSTNGTSPKLIQIGDSGGYEATGYLGSDVFMVTTSQTLANLSSGFSINSTAAADIIHGEATLNLVDPSTNTWTCTVSWALSNGAVIGMSYGSKSLSATLDRIRLTTAGGVNTFDAGLVNILYQS